MDEWTETLKSIPNSILKIYSRISEVSLGGCYKRFNITPKFPMLAMKTNFTLVKCKKLHSRSIIRTSWNLKRILLRDTCKLQIFFMNKTRIYEYTLLSAVYIKFKKRHNLNYKS